MNRKYERQLELAVVSLGVAVLALMYLAICIGLYTHAQNQEPSVITPRPAVAHDHRPDVRHCINNPDVEIWACIRDNPKPSPASVYRQMSREDI